MSRLRRAAAAIVAACFLAETFTAAAQERRGEFFSGAFMIAVQGPVGQELRSRLDHPGNDDAVTLLFDSGVDEEEDEVPATWIVTRPLFDEGEGSSRGNGSAWDEAHAMVDDPMLLIEHRFPRDMAEVLASSGALFTIEPDIAIWDPETEDRYRAMLADPEASDDEAEEEPYLIASVAMAAPPPLSVRVRNGEERARPWPPKRNAPFAWHFDEAHSNLDQARRTAAPFFSRVEDQNVLIYHLDTGYYDVHDTIRPQHIDARSISFLKVDGYNGKVRGAPSGQDRFRGGLLSNEGHGAKTLSVLAGNHIRVPGRNFSGYLGGAPLARVASCRIGQSVVHFRTETMAHAIATAIDQNADVITMAAGGPPSLALLKAVNRAYDRGIPMVFAAGDYYKILLGGEIPPHTTVYPARLGRAIAVTGVTYAQRDYGQASYLKFRSRPRWISMRGSYGPDEVLAHSIGAYTPNVAAQFPAGKNMVTERFAGTSAATPQVAAAAALWLQMHRNGLPRDWRRAEAVYQALFRSARRDPSRKLHRYVGWGTLDAAAALRVPTDLARLRKRPPSTIGFDWLSAAAIRIGLLDASIFGAKAAVHHRMFLIEAAQLYHGSNRLRQALGGDPDRATEGQQRRFLSEIVRDPRASEKLKSYIRRILG
jgi:hypothetical protein